MNFIKRNSDSGTQSRRPKGDQKKRSRTIRPLIRLGRRGSSVVLAELLPPSILWIYGPPRPWTISVAAMNQVLQSNSSKFSHGYKGRCHSTVMPLLPLRYHRPRGLAAQCMSPQRLCPLSIPFQKHRSQSPIADDNSMIPAAATRHHLPSPHPLHCIDPRSLWNAPRSPPRLTASVSIRSIHSTPLTHSTHSTPLTHSTHSTHSIHSAHLSDRLPFSIKTFFQSSSISRQSLIAARRFHPHPRQTPSRSYSSGNPGVCLQDVPPPLSLQTHGRSRRRCWPSMRQSTRSFALSRRPSNRPLIYFSRTARIRPVGLLGPRPRMPFDINNRTARVPRTPPPLPFSGGNFQPYPLFERIDPATLPVTAVADEPSSYLSLGTLLAHPLPERSIDLPDTRTLDAWLHRCLEECSTEQLVHVAGLLMQSKHILEYRVKDKHLLGLLFERLYEAQGQGLGSDRIYGYAKFLHAQKLPLTERQVFYFLRLCERRYDHRQIIAVHSSWEQSHPESQLFVQIPAQRILMGAFATLGHFDAGYDYLSRLLDTGHVIDRSVSDRLFRACIFERNAAKVLQLWHWIAMNAVPVTSQAVVALMSTQDTRLSLKNLHAQAEEAYSSVPPWAWVERNPKFFLESIRMYTAKSRFKNAEAVLEDLWRTSTDRRLLIQGTVILINAYNRRAPLQSQPYKLFRRLARLDHSVRAPRVAAANVASVDTEDLSSVAADDASVGAANNVPPDSVITAGPSGADNTISDSSSSDASMLDAYAAILRWCRFNSKTGLAMYLYNQMIAKGLSPTLEIYATMMRCFAYLRDLPRAKAVIQEIDSRGHIPDRFTYSSILAVYARNRQLDKIGHICDEMRDRGVKFDADIYHVLLHAYAKCGRFKTVESLYQSLLQDGIVPTATTFANLIQGALHFKRQARALGWINEMARSNIEPSSSVLDVMIADRLDNNDFENAFSLLELMFNLDIVPTRTTYENFLTKLGRYDKLSRKQLQQQRSIHSELMSRLPENQKKSQKAQELLMVYHCRQQQYDRVFEVFRALEANGRRIGYHAYKAMIMSRHQTGDTDEMCRLLDLMVHDGWKPSIALFAKLIGDLSSDPRDFLAQFFVYQRIRQCQRYPTPQIYRRMLDSAAREKNYKALYQIYHDLLRTPHGFHRETVVYFFDVVVQSIIQPIINGDGLYSESSFRFLHRVVRLSRCNRIRYRWYHEPLLRLYDFAISEENKDAELVLKVWNLFISKNKYYQTLFQPPYGHTDIKLDYDYMMEILGLQFRSGSALSTYWESVIRGRYVSVLGPVTVDLWHRYFKLLSWLDMYDELLAIGTTGIRSLKGESLEAQMHLVEEVNRILRTRAKLDHRNELLKFWNLAK